MNGRLATVALAAALLLALLALAACGGESSTAPGGGTAPEEQDLTPVETEPAPGGGLAEDEVELSIEDQETNDILGSALLSPESEGSTRVSVFLDEFERSGRAEIRGGRCEEPEAEVVHDLGALDEGYLDTLVDTTLEDLLAPHHALWTQTGTDGPRGCALIAPFGVDLD